MQGQWFHRGSSLGRVGVKLLVSSPSGYTLSRTYNERQSGDQGLNPWHTHRIYDLCPLGGQQSHIIPGFSLQVITRDFEPCKPDPSSVLHICRRWQLEPHQVAIIGDDKTDMICGIRAGTACNVARDLCLYHSKGGWLQYTILPSPRQYSVTMY